MDTEIKARLDKLALQRSIPFCYTCCQLAPTGRCLSCWSDDLMRYVEGVSYDYGTDWIIEHLLRENLTPLDIEAAFAESVAGCYPETVTIGWIEYDTVSAIKELDPVSWDLAKSEWIDSEEQNDQVVTFDNGSTYYWVADVESFLDTEEAG